MLAKLWKKVGLFILIVACIFNVMYKLINKLSLNKEMVYSAEYMYQIKEQEENKN